MTWSGRGGGGMLGRGVGCISTSAGSSLGQMSTGSSLGHTSLDGGQLEGCRDESEPVGDHMMRGEGLVPEVDKGKGCSGQSLLRVCFIRLKLHWQETKVTVIHRYLDMEGETPAYLEYPPHRHLPPAESRNRRLKSLQDEKPFYMIPYVYLHNADEDSRGRRKLAVPWLLKGCGMSQTS